MRIELATLRLYVWPHLLRACRARGFALQIIDQSAGTDVDPPSRPELEVQQTRQIFDEHLSKRNELKTYLNCLILLSNRSVGPVPRLPVKLREQTILYVKESAQREIVSIGAEVKELKRQLYSADANQEQKDQKATKFESTDNTSQASGLSTGSRISSKEDLLRHKSELIQALSPDVLQKWYRCVSSGSNEAERMYHLQPVRSVYPDVLRYEDQSRRQAAIECWLKDSHHIACLFMRYIKPCQKNAGDSEALPNSMAGRRGSNLETTTREADEDETKERVPDEEDRAFIMESGKKLLFYATLYAYQGISLGRLLYILVTNFHMSSIAIEEQLEAFLTPGKESKDCFVVVRLHDDQSRQSRLLSINKRSESLSLPTNRSVLNVSLFSTNGPINPLLDSHLEAPFEESENRAKRVVEDSILCVPPANQSQYDLAVFTHLTLEDRIFRKRPPLEPLDQKEHSSYLEAFCRSIREQFMTSLVAEMNRRMEKERQNQHGAEADKQKIWDLEYEISAHWEMCEKMASEFVGQSEKLDEIVGWIDSCTKEIQNVAEDLDPPEGRFHWLTVSGSSGCGKSVLLAKLAKTMLLDEHMRERARVVYRSIGSSTVSLKLLDTLHYLCCELSTQMKPSLLPQNYDGLRNAMHDALIEASYEQPSSLPLVVVLDGIENFEEFAQRSAYFPVSWLPADWILRQPRLNCPVFFVLGVAATSQNSERMPGKTGLLDLLRLPQTESTHLKHIQLTPLGERDVNICLRVWIAENYSNQHTVEKDLQLKHESDTLNPLSLRLLQAMRLQGNDLNELEDYTPSTVLHAWFACAEQEFGYEKVQFIMGHLLAARWGLDMEDLLTLGLHSMRNRIQVTPGVKMTHRHTVAAVNWDQWFTSVSTDELVVTFLWVIRFFNAYLIPTGILCRRRGPPDGSAIFYYLRHGAVHHVAQVRYLEKLNNVQTYRNLSFWALQEMQMRGVASLSSWRWIFELPCYLSQSGQFERLRNLCFFSPTWLSEVMDVSVQFNQYYTNVHLVMEEIVRCLCYLNEEKVLFTVATVPIERANYDPFVLAICTILGDDDDLLRLLTALGGWIPRMKQDPVLLNSLIYGTFYSKKDGLEDLGKLAQRVQHEMNNLVLKPINFNTQVSIGCVDYVAERLISSFQNSSLTFARTSLHVTALAHSPNRRYLATATKDTVTLKVKIDIWQLSTNQIVWSQTVGLGLVDRIDQLVWVTNQAILAVEFPKHRMTVWPIDKEKSSWGDTYFQLSDNRGKAQESCLVYAVETPVAGISYVLILNLADLRIDVWRWKWTSLEYMHTSITLVESEQMPLKQYSTEVHHRRRSSLAPKPSIGLFIAATVRNNLFHFVCASRNEAVARLVSFELKDKDLVLDFKNKVQEELLSCPNQGARIFAVDIVENGPVVLASRAPSEYPINSGVVGCLDLFDLPSGKFLKHIEGEPATLEFIESGPSGGFGLMSKSIPPQLKLFSSPDATSVVSVSESFEKKIKTDISMEVLCWNLVNRTNLTLTSAALLPQLVTEVQKPLPLPVLADNCGVRSLSLCFPRPVSDPNIIWNCSPLKRAQKTLQENAVRKKSICTLVGLNAPNKQSITYVYHDVKDGWHFGLLLEMEGSHLGAESCDRYVQKLFQVQPVESKIWSSTDRFLLGGNLLVVLSNLTYSEERGESK
ncbi:hypothetical protein T265_09550 [Opisthorchis viverrini]|uniref:NACHT domain-containing protein n=1 Tax=Opisthorchis viverrini TaxID=6198 RepID=A0A074Z9T2_OPIVI|nr:hypothetical protein T265_09550 [Opisthorchis viverrini]KER22332.1 hypothetical protein T265_09550 [Opisthorchis viverrini]